MCTLLPSWSPYPPSKHPFICFWLLPEKFFSTLSRMASLLCGYAFVASSHSFMRAFLQCEYIYVSSRGRSQKIVQHTSWRCIVSPQYEFAHVSSGCFFLIIIFHICIAFPRYGWAYVDSGYFSVKSCYTFLTTEWVFPSVGAHMFLKSNLSENAVSHSCQLYGFSPV